ncbi:MAG: hypothetical protein HQ521_22055 [Bacteroidetes bacterium]|nr:hypothetical protein [Bacteroidota bacterium]
MGSNTVDITALQQYAEKYGKGLLKIAVTDNEAFQKLDVVAGVKDKFTMTTLRFQRLLRPYKRDWDPATDKANLVPRTLRVEIGEIMLEEEPMAYRKTYLGQVMKKGVNPTDHPFEKDFLEGISRQAASDFNDITAFWGIRNAAGTGPADVNDGFFTIIDAEIALNTISVALKNMINTAAIDLTNAVAKLKAFYRAACEINPALRGKKVKLLISHTIMDAYNDNYQALNQALPYNKEFEKTFLEGSGHNCILEPMTGMGTTKRIILTVDWNMSVGTDLESDQESVSITKGINPKVVGFYLAAAYGVQIWTLNDVFFTNEPGVDA